MPTAPRLERQVADAPFPNVRVGAAPSSDTFGGQIGDTLSHQAVKLYDITTRSANHAAVLEADTLAGQEQLRIQQAFLQMRGKEAANAPQYALEEWDKANDTIAQRLANDTQRAQYQSIARSKREVLNLAALRHFNQENDRFLEDSYQANLSNSVNIARANAESPMAVAFELDVQQQKVREHAALHGYGDTPQEHAELWTLRSKTNTEVINGLLIKGQDLRAQAYYKNRLALETAHPETLQFTAPDRDVVEKNVLEGSTRGAARRVVDDLIVQFGTDTPEQERTILDAIHTITNVKVADMAEERFLHQVAVNKQIKAETYTRTFTNAAKMIDETALKYPEATLTDIIPPPLLTQLQPNEQHTLKEHLKSVREPEARTHNPRAWVAFRELPDEELAAMKLEKFAALLTDFDAVHADRAVEQRNAAKAGTDHKAGALLSDKELAHNLIVQSGAFDNSIEPAKRSDKDIILRARLDDHINQALSALRKDATLEEKTKAIKAVLDDDIKTTYIVDPGFFSRNKQVPGVAVQDYADARSIRIPLKDIPAAHLDTIKGIFDLAKKPYSVDKAERIAALQRLRQTGKISREKMIAQSKAIILE